MVQAAAQAQAVVAAAKNRGGGLVPMNAAQIDALSQIQARAIVNARPQTALVGSSGAAAGTKPGEPTPQQIQNQIQLQAQALVHAHTQAQIAAGIFKETEKTKAPSAPSASSTLMRSSAPQSVGMKRPAPASNVPLVPLTSGPSAGLTFVQRIGEGGYEDDGMPVMDAKSPEFLAKMEGTLTEFWAGQLQEMRTLGSDKVQTEQDFKNHNDLPLARIKRIMKSDEDVRMISAEAPVLFAKACEMFILEMTLRSWNYSENNKRKTLLKEDVKEAIQRTDIFDFLVDVID
jgi:nuclear transcription factor Y gamma